MPRGGARPGAGRKPGSVTKKTSDIAKRAAADGLSPVEYLLKVMRNPRRPVAMRMQAATAAAPYVHPRLSAINISLEELTEEELREAAAGGR